MRKDKLIVIHQENIIECDNCDFVIPNESKEPLCDLDEYLNLPCPKCYNNLMTAKQYKEYKRFMKIVNFVNKYLWWLKIFANKE